MRESTGFTEKKDAENLLKQRVGEVAAGRRVGSEKATIEDLCNLAIADAEMRKLRDVPHLRWRYGAHIKPILGNLRASRFGPSQIREYIKRRRAEDASNSTINRELAIVRRGFRLGSHEEPPLVLRQPAFPMLEEDNVRQGFIERPHYETLLAELPENLRALFVCAYHVGARKNELRRIKWEQVDFAAQVIWLSAGQTKGKKARVLPIYGDMERWLRTQQETVPKGNPFVFHGSRGYPIDNHMLGWGEACERAGFPGLLIHDLRRSAVRNMARAGVPREIRMKITGHRTESMDRRYNITVEAEVKSVVGQMEDYFQQASPAKLKRVK
jgi:integrase